MKLTKTLMTLILLFLLCTTLFIVGCGKHSDNLDAFAFCLNEKGAKMYGAHWCEFCKQQKMMFGSSFTKINYIECTVNKQLCIEEGISGYPIWKFADGSILGGVQEFKLLSDKTGCSMP